VGSGKEKKRKEKKRKEKKFNLNLDSTVVYSFITSILFVLFRRRQIFLSPAVEGKIVFYKKKNI
jgi:hypothetical protein